MRNLRTVPDRPTHYGEELRVVRVKAGLSQAELAARWGVGRPTVSKWERIGKPLSPLVADAMHGLAQHSAETDAGRRKGS